MTRVRVVGAGLTGLATAWYLTERGATVDVIEAANAPGGLIRTQRHDGVMVEAAARAFTGSERVSALFRALDLEAVTERRESKRRYILRNGRPRRWPLGPIESAGLAAHLAASWVTRGMRAREGESVAEWGRRVIGPAGTRWLLAPALQGIYASPPDALSAMAIFGGRRRPRGPLVAPRDGMGALIDRLVERVCARGGAVRCGVALNRLDRVDSAVPTVICTDAPAAARLLAPIAPTLAAAIVAIRMTSLRSITVCYPPAAGDLRGFGVLFPREAGIAALGAIFNADVFPGRGDARSETWIYGALSPDDLPADDATLIRAVRQDRRALTGRDDLPAAAYPTPGVQRLPIYDRAVLDAARALDTDLPPGLAVAGNYLGRIGVSALVDAAFASAERIVPRTPAADVI